MGCVYQNSESAEKYRVLRFAAIVPAEKTLSGMTQGRAYGNEAADARVADPADACYPVAVHESSAA